MSLSKKSEGDMGTAFPRGLSGSFDATRLGGERKRKRDKRRKRAREIVRKREGGRERKRVQTDF